MSWNISPNILISPLTTTIQISTPKEEYEKRVHEQQRLVSEMNLPIKVIDAGYAPQTFFDMAKGFVPVYAYVHMTQMNLAESNGLALVLAASVSVRADCQN